MSEGLRSQPWARTLQDLVVELPGLVSDRLELLALELHRAGRSLVQIMALVLATAILVTTAWFVLCGGLSMALVAQGLSWPLALLAVLPVNLVLAWAAMSRVRGLLANLGLTATRRHLVFGAEAALTAGVQLQRPPFTSSSEARP